MILSLELRLGILYIHPLTRIIKFMDCIYRETTVSCQSLCITMGEKQVGQSLGISVLSIEESLNIIFHSYMLPLQRLK